MRPEVHFMTNQSIIFEISRGLAFSSFHKRVKGRWLTRSLRGESERESWVGGTEEAVELGRLGEWPLLFISSPSGLIEAPSTLNASRAH